MYFKVVFFNVSVSEKFKLVSSVSNSVRHYDFVDYFIWANANIARGSIAIANLMLQIFLSLN